MTNVTEKDFEAAKVLPVIEIDDADKAEDLAGALADGGLRVLELTLRSDAALPALTRMKKKFPDLIVGMGTILDMEQAKASEAAGADFFVTPGATSPLLAGLAAMNIPTLPGVATLSEAMTAMSYGFDCLKFFPAEPSGGPAVLKAFAGPLPAARFCPTGGISYDKIAAYRALPNVMCVGGSWVAPRDAVVQGDWKSITVNAQRVAALSS